MAPPPSGEVSGESNSLGLHGFSLRIPESTLRMPSLQLPSMVRYRREPEMLTDHSRATFQSQPAARLQFARPQANPPSGSQQANPPSANQQANPPGCTQPVMPCCPFPTNRNGCVQNGTVPQSDEMARLQEQLAQLTVVVGQLAAMQQGRTMPAPVPIQPVGFQTATAQPSRSDLQQLQAQSQVPQQSQALYEQKCRELEEMQAQLASVQWEYQSLLEAKQTQLTQQREARLRKQFTDGNPVASEPQASPSTAGVVRMSAKRSANVDPELPQHPALGTNAKVNSERADNSHGQAPSQFRRQPVATSASRPHADVARLPEEQLPSDLTDTFSDADATREFLEPAVEADEKRATTNEVKQPFGSRLGRWIKRGK
ncbi:MAG: hypothetical protein H7062_15805 [Candidatus Saccharimonas sp.]|nr:hypothetical protein [Planctomycetaceae bacterium]